MRLNDYPTRKDWNRSSGNTRNRSRGTVFDQVSRVESRPAAARQASVSIKKESAKKGALKIMLDSFAVQKRYCDGYGTDRNDNTSAREDRRDRHSDRDYAGGSTKTNANERKKTGDGHSTRDR
jgi:hypothetical protein